MEGSRDEPFASADHGGHGGHGERTREDANDAFGDDAVF